MNKVPYLRFDTAEFPPGEGFERWRAALPTYDITDLGAPGAFRVRTEAWMLGDFAASQTQITPVRLVRTAEQIAADGNDHLVFFLFLRGAGLCDFDGRPSIYGPGQVALFDLARPFDASGTDAESDNVAVNVSRAAIVEAVPLGCELHGLAFNETVGRVMADHIMWLMRRLPHMALDDAPAAVKATLGLFVACIAEAARLKSAEEEDRDFRVRNRVGHYIDQNLRAPDLAPEKICDELGLSRSVLYRAFEPVAGVADYIRARRLEAVHVLLEDPAVERNISSIARDFGFTNEAHFSRTFRQRYGYSPRTARTDKAGRIEALTRLVHSHASPDLYRAWLAQIG